MIETVLAERNPLRATVSKAKREDRAAPGALRSLLFPSDLSAASDRAFDHARLLAERFRAMLVLYHVVPPQAGTTETEPGDLWLAMARSAREHLERQTYGLGTDSSVLIWRAASAAADLPGYVRSIRPDLTVMATQGRDGVAHLFRGSLTEAVVRESSGPVLCVREPDHGTALPYRRILVPTDLSEASRRAFPLAALLAQAFESDVIALHATDVEVPSRLLGVSYGVEAAPSEEAVGRFLQPQFEEVYVRPRVRSGPAWRAILETAQAEHADLIVLSTHGHDSLADVLIGSQAERVIRHAPCPVLVV
jgi:nucleotide-binding universal stress UspA family protein